MSINSSQSRYGYSKNINYSSFSFSISCKNVALTNLTAVGDSLLILPNGGGMLGKLHKISRCKEFSKAFHKIRVNLFIFQPGKHLV